LATLENIWAWLTTAAGNDTADSGINFVEGQDANTLNNSARGMMAAIKKWANVNSGNVGVAGTADAITITTGQTISSGHQALGFRICFKAAFTNTGAATVAVDGLTAVAIKRPNNDALSAGDIVSGAFHDIAFDGTNYKLLNAGSSVGGSLSGTNYWTGMNVFQGTTYIGDETTDSVVIKGVSVSTFGSQMLSGASSAAWRAGLELGSAAQYNVGTNGAAEGSVVPLLNGGNTWSATQISATSGNLYGWIFTRPTSYTTSAFYINNTGGDAANRAQAYFLANGSVVGAIYTNVVGGTGGSTTFSGTSDDRLKRASTPLADSGAIIDQLAPIRFRWMRDDGPEDFGFSAQALHAVVPQAVTPGKGNPGDKDFVPWMREKGALEAILVAEIQALRARLAALEAG
jgi:hypothetical protein